MSERTAQVRRLTAGLDQTKDLPEDIEISFQLLP
jgi:hypothetical protein